ncbi:MULTISPECIES: AbrB family transcriptional regulator [Bhargavaea]|uniref:AbrB family transcriptional regulator n=1 Tax=Bhargavaea changchunensis TaxID=2134037 RepID=A0ABW2NHW7_9BACL|nr:AbrB family transcriptional regulator [Bhargavaea sp. CC-171006]
MKTPENKKKWNQLFEALLCGLAGGAIFSWIGLPLAWMLGPLTAVILWNLLTKRTLYWPKNFKNGGQMLLGYSMGLSFTAQSASQIAGQLPSMTVSTVLMVIVGLGIAYLASKLTGINAPSAVMGTTPGGLSQMTMLSEEIRGADPTIVTFMQTIRMLAVTFMVPMLATYAFAGGSDSGIPASSAVVEQAVPGSMMHLLMTVVAVLTGTALALRLRFPTPWILGPLITAAILTVSGFPAPHLPPLLMVAAQLLMGVYLGLSIRLDMLKDWKKLLPFSLVSGSLMVGFALLLAYILHLIHPMSMATAFLCIAPGGLPEMGVTAHEIRADVSMVAAYQLFRVFFILFLVPLFLRFAFGRRDTAGKTAESV